MWNSLWLTPPPFAPPPFFTVRSLAVERRALPRVLLDFFFMAALLSTGSHRSSCSASPEPDQGGGADGRDQPTMRRGWRGRGLPDRAAGRHRAPLPPQRPPRPPP